MIASCGAEGIKSLCFSLNSHKSPHCLEAGWFPPTQTSEDLHKGPAQHPPSYPKHPATRATELQDGSFAVNIHLLWNLGAGKNTALEHGGKSWESYFEVADNARCEQHFVFLFVLKTLRFQLKLQRVRVCVQEGEQKPQRHRE